MKKNDNQRLVFILILAFVTGISICMILNLVRVSLIEYEYSKDGQFGISKECYVTEKGHCMCKINNNFVVVDNYYEV